MGVWRLVSAEKATGQPGASVGASVGVSAGDAGTPLTLGEFTTLVDRHQRELHLFVAGLVGERELARDLTQDAFHDAWRATLAGVRPFITEAPDDERRRWLFTVAYRKGVTALRRRRLIRWESLDVFRGWGQAQEGAFHGEEADPILFEDQIAESEALRMALAQLAPADVACLLLRVVQGFSASEVAAIVGCSPDAVAKRLSRARQRLRAAYRAQEGDEQPEHAFEHDSPSAHPSRPNASTKKEPQS